MKNKKTLWIGGGVLLLVLCMGLVYWFAKPKTSAGLKHVAVEVRDEAGETKDYRADTNAETLIGVLDELKKKGDFDYEGQNGDYGMYIVSVNGLTADYNVNQAYWAIYVNGEYGSYGVSEQPVADGDTFTLAFEK